jgi:hypothetical protein
MIPSADYWRAVASSIEAENVKAGVFIEKNNQALGTAREGILRDALARHTPEPFRLTTGLVCHFMRGLWNSRQCDVLVYNAAAGRPYYETAGLSVVPVNAASVVVEVKSTLDGREFDKVKEVVKSVNPFVPTLGFAYDGLTIGNFLERLAECQRADPQTLPDCLAVHARNYVAFRATHVWTTERHPIAVYDFSPMGGDATGLATAVLFSTYEAMLRTRHFVLPDRPDLLYYLEGAKVQLWTVTAEGDVKEAG